MEAKARRITIAQLQGEALRHAHGRGTGDPVAELRAISTDPALLGTAAGMFLVRCEDGDPDAPAALRLLREAGAAEEVLAEEADRVRQRPRWPGVR